jgi:hypothetical protein
MQKIAQSEARIHDDSASLDALDRVLPNEAAHQVQTLCGLRRPGALLTLAKSIYLELYVKLGRRTGPRRYPQQ